MANVKLPDGTVVTDVPDDIGQAELVRRLQKNGYDTSWYKSEPTITDWILSPSDTRGPTELQSDLAQMSPLRQIGEGAVGGVESAASMATAIPGMFAAGGGMLAGLATGENLEEAIARGQSEMERFTYKPRTTAGQVFNEYLGTGFEKAKEFAGDVVTKIPQVIPGPGGQVLKALGEPAARTFGEASAEAAVVTLPGLSGLKAAKGSIQANLAQTQASEILAKRLAEEQAEAAKVVAKAKFQAELMELDNLMQRYPQDLQAPQIGGGGRVARIPDQLGKRKKGEYTSQLKFDEDIRIIAEEQQRALQEIEAQKTAPLTYEPEQLAVRAAPERAEQPRIYDIEKTRMAQDFQKDIYGPDQPHILEQQAGGLEYPGTEPARALSDKPGFLQTAEDRINLQRDYNPLEPTTGLKPRLVGPTATLREPELRFPYLQGKNPTLQFRQQQAIAAQQPLSARQSLEIIKRTTTVGPYKELATKLLEDPTFNPEVVIESLVDTDGLAAHGKYKPSRHQVTISPRSLGWDEPVLHELTHARTYGAIELVKNFPKHPLAKGYQKPVLRLQVLGERFAQELRSKGGLKELMTLGGRRRIQRAALAYGFTNLHEFVALARTQPDFQALLMRTKLPADLRTKNLRYYWDALVDAIRQIVGLKPTSRNHTFLSEIIKASDELMDTLDSKGRTIFRSGQQGPKPADVEMYSLEDFTRELEARGIPMDRAVAKAMYETQFKPTEPVMSAHPKEAIVSVLKDIKGLKQIQQQYVDSRTYEEIRPELQRMKDVTVTGANIIPKIIQGKFTAADNPLWSWTSSQVHWIKNQAIKNSHDKLYGGSRKNPDSGTYNFWWKQLTRTQRDDLRRVGWSLNDFDGPVTPDVLQTTAQKLFGRNLNLKQIQAYQDRVRINKEILGEVNKKLLAEDKEPIAELPNYWSPNTFDGPFLVKFVDPQTGTTKKIVSSYLRPKMDNLIREFPEHRLELIEKGMRGELDFDQFEFVLRQLSSELRDPAAKAIAEGLRRMGFAKHGLKRTGVEGGKGSGTGLKALRDYEEVTERYIRQAYDWIANRDLDKLHNTLATDTTLDHLPNARGFALESIDTARGGLNKYFGGFSRALGEVFREMVSLSTLRTVNLPQKALRDLLRHSNEVKTALLLAFGNIPMIIAQVIQAPTFATPKMLALGAKSGLSAPATIAKTIEGLIKSTIKLTKWDIDPDIQKLQRIGALDATTRYDWSTYASDTDPRFKANLREHFTGLSLLMWIESNVVRRPASLMFLETLRAMGYDKIAKTPDEIFYMAKELTDQYMVSQKWFEKPHAFSRTGIVGTALGPLQSFTTTWIGMFREYTKLSTEGLIKPNLAKQLPLATFLGLNLATAGMLGVIGIKEWDALANFLNEKFGMRVMSGTEWTFSTFKNPKMRFGLLSNTIGYHVGSTFGAPTLTGSFAPGVSFLGDVARFGKTMGQRGLNTLNPNVPAPTSVEMRDSLKGVTPRFFPVPKVGLGWGEIEELYTPPGKPYQTMTGDAGPVTRTPEDWQARRLGTYTPREVTERTKGHLGKREAQQRSQRLSNAIRHAVDIILTDSNPGPKLEPIWKSLEVDKFSGMDIKNALKRELLSQSIEEDIRLQGRGNTSRQQFIRQFLQQLR